jgi:hypothetical protein
MRNRWQPGNPGSLPTPGPEPGPGPRPKLKARRSRRRGLQIFQLVAALAAGALVAILTTTDHLSLRSPVGKTTLTGQTAATGQPAPTTSQSQSTPTPPPAVPTGMPTDFDTALPAPTGLTTLGLNSTIRVNWTPAAGSSVAWQLVSIWDGATLMGEKVLAANANAADGNGLQSGHTYTVAVQSLGASGHLSRPITAWGSTDPQSPMSNAVFFENFNEAQAGPLDPNYFDVRLRDGSTTPDGVSDRARVFVSEHHFHTEIISGEGDAAVTIRPRATFDFANRVGTFQFEVDMAAVQSIPGKWFEIHLSRQAPADAQFFGLATNENDTYPDDLDFTVARPLNATDPNDVQAASIGVNTSTGFQKTFIGKSNNFTPHNVRVPVVIQVSQTSAEMFINGVSVVKATGFTLPFTSGQWTIAQRAFYAPRSPSFPAFLQLIHWQTVQFDGPNGGFSPVRKTYLAPGCPGAKNAFEFDCTVSAGAAINVNIPDAVSGITSARLIFNPYDSGNCDHGTYNVSAVVNGNSISAPAQPATPEGQGEHCYDNNLAQVAIPPTWLKTGSNVVKLGRQADQVELEVAFNTPRAISSPAVTPGPVLAVTNDNLLTGRPTGATTVDLTTYLFSQGGSTPIPYQVINKTGSITPWLSIVTPTSGTISSVATGGSMVPITVRIDFTRTDKDPGNVIPAILQITGNVYIAIGYDRTSPVYDYAIKTFSPMMTTFDKAAIPGYHGSGSPPPTSQPSGTPTLPPTATPKPSPSGCKP